MDIHFNNNKNASIFNGVWRETTEAFINYLNSINEQVYYILRLDDREVLYIDYANDRHGMDAYMKSFIELFLTSIGKPLKQYCMVFLPEINDRCIQYNMISQIIKKMTGQEVLLLYREDYYKETISRNFTSYKNYRVTYNARLNVQSFSDLEEYLRSLSSKQRHYLKRSMEIFEMSETLKLKKINFEDNKTRMISLYKECCEKHGDFIESNTFLENLKLAQNVEWYGVFDGSKLVMFSGYWKNRDSAVLGLFGKDYKCEQMIREYRAYFILKLCMIEKAIRDNMNTIYDGFGVGDIKKRMGFIIDNYAILVKQG